MRIDLAMRMVSLLATVVFSPVHIGHELSVRPRVDRIEPQGAAPGEVVTAFGVNLGRACVLDLMLSSSERMALTHIVEQSDAEISFRIPQSLAAGRYQILLAVETRSGMETLGQPVAVDVLQE